MRLAGRILVESRRNIGLGTALATPPKHRPHGARDSTASPIDVTTPVKRWLEISVQRGMALEDAGLDARRVGYLCPMPNRADSVSVAATRAATTRAPTTPGHAT